MAHFAEIDNNNIVQRVIVISNDDLLDANGVEQEALGIAVCQAVCGGGTWVQTSYNSKFRNKYAGIGDKYDSINDVFYNPNRPYPSWELDSNFKWQPPIDRPDDGKFYYWSEEDFAWVEFGQETA